MSNFRFSRKADMSDEEYKNIYLPTSKSFDEFLNTYIIPEITAFYIANAFSKNVFFERNFLEHFHDVFNHTEFPILADFNNSQTEIVKLLNIKYGLDIICDNPLTLKRITY